MELALEKLLAILDEQLPPRVEVRSLNDPARPALHLSGADRSEWGPSISEWIRITDRKPRPPLPVQMATGVGHWALTDGADAEVNHWIGAVPISRVIQSGAATENSAIERVSLRASPEWKNGWRGLVQVGNTGMNPARRTLVLSIAGQTVSEWDVELPAGLSRQIGFDLPASSKGEIAVRLEPPDALSLDDSLSLSIPEPVSVRIFGDCGAHVMAALQSHPRITFDGKQPVAGHDSGSKNPSRIASDGTSQLAIVCGDWALPDEGAVLRLHRAETREVSKAGPIQDLKSPAVWLDLAGKLQRLHLESEWLNAVEAKKGEASKLLISGSMPLITLIEFPRRRVDCYLDLSQSRFVLQPEFPALIAGLMDLLVEEDLLEGVRAQSRPAGESRIAPLGLPEPSEPGKPWKEAVANSTASPSDLAPGLILMLMAALLFDGWLSGRRRDKPLPG